MNRIDCMYYDHINQLIGISVTLLVNCNCCHFINQAHFFDFVNQLESTQFQWFIKINIISCIINFTNQLSSLWVRQSITMNIIYKSHNISDNQLPLLFDGNQMQSILFTSDHVFLHCLCDQFYNQHIQPTYFDRIWQYNILINFCIETSLLIYHIISIQLIISLSKTYQHFRSSICSIVNQHIK